MSNSNLFNLEGTIKIIFDTQNINDKFRKREFILEVSDGSQYPQLVKFELTQDGVSKLDLFRTNDRVVVEFVLKGREWTNPKGERVYFTTINATNISNTNDPSLSSPKDDDPFIAPPPPGKEEDLPF